MRSSWACFLVFVAALAYAAHIWVVRWDLVLANVVIPLLEAIYLALYFWSCGALLVRTTPLRRRDSDPETAIVLGLGVGCGGLVLLGMGAMGLLRLSVFAPWSACVVVLGMWSARPWSIRRQPGPSLRPPDVPLLGLLGAWTILVVALAFVPETSWDALAYHLATGKLYVQHAGIVPLPWLFQSNFPINVDLVFLHGLLLGNEQVPVLLALLLGLLALAAAWRLARLFLSASHSLVAILLLAFTPEVAQQIDNCQVELGWTAFAVLSLACVLEWRRGSRGSDRWLHLSAIFAGLAAGAKVPGLVGGAAVAAIVLLSPSSEGRRSWGAVARFAGLFVLVASPCYVKSWIQTGTPIWPLTLGVFHPKPWNTEIHARFLEVARAEWAPLAGTSFGSFVLGAARIAWHEGGWAVWMFVLLVGASALAWRRARDIWPLLLFAAAQFLGWGFVTQQSRFLLPAVPAMAVALIRLTRPADPCQAGAGVRGNAPGACFAGMQRAAFVAAPAALLLAALPTWFPRLSLLAGPAMQLVRGAKSREQTLMPSRIYRVCEQINRIAPPGARILLLGENRGYWLDRDYMWGDAFNQAVIDYAALHDSNQLRARLAELGITHALVGPLWQNGGLLRTSVLADLLVANDRRSIETSYALYDLGQPAVDDRPLLISSSNQDGCPAEEAMDGRLESGTDGGGGWMSSGIPTPSAPEELLVFYPRPTTFHRIRLLSHGVPGLALGSFVFQYDASGSWTDIPGTRVQAAAESGVWNFEFAPIETRRIRLLIVGARDGPARVVEMEID